MGGLELLEARSASAHPDTLTVIMTGFGTVETAIDAMKRGAYDYILKPFKVEEVVHIVQRGLEKQRLAAENLRLREALSLYKVSEAIAASLSLDEVIATVDRQRARRGRAPTSSSTWLDDGEGGFFERSARRASRDLPRADELGRARSATRVVEHFGTSEPLRRARRAQRRELLRRAARARRSRASLIVPLHDARARSIGWIARLSFTASKRFDEGQRKLLSIVALARRRGDRERAALRGPPGHLPADDPGPGAAPSTRWTATPPATPSAWRATRVSLATLARPAARRRSRSSASRR